MRINLLISNKLSLSQNFFNGFTYLGHAVQILHYQNYIKNYYQKINNQIFRFPHLLKTKWRSFFAARIEQAYKNMIENDPADLYIVYNNQMLTPSIVSYIKSKGAAVTIFMGDSPFYTKTNPWYLSILFQVDYVFCPDTNWVEQLYMLGIKHVDFLVPGFNPAVFKKVAPSGADLQKYGANCVFMGLNYDSDLGLKRSLFLSKFANLGLRIYGDKNWERWLERFPELHPCYIKKEKFIPDEEWNLICNCAKIQPIDANPGLTNGIHIRVFDSIGSGILPIAEYRKDMDRVFPGDMLPTVKSYDDIFEMAKFYLENESARIEKTAQLYTHVRENYSNVMACQQILDALRL